MVCMLIRCCVFFCYRKSTVNSCPIAGRMYADRETKGRWMDIKQKGRKETEAGMNYLFG